MLSDVLVIGTPRVRQALASRLRMAGRSTWSAGSMIDVRWLLEAATIRPALMVLALGDETAERAAMIDELRRLPRLAQIPVILVGAAAHERAAFTNVRLALPAGAALQTIIDAVSQR